MYEAYWRLTTKPFEPAVDDFYYPAEPHQAALLKLRYALESRRPAALLVGGSGLGKTTLARLLCGQLNASAFRVARVVFPQMPPHELLRYVARQLDEGGDRAGGSIAETLHAIECRLGEAFERGQHTVIVADEAHLLHANGNLETLRLLLNLECANVAPLTLLLVGQPSLLSVLERMPQLDDRLGVKCHLRPLGVEETVAYVHHRLRAAGCERELFTREALEVAHHLSQGSPRRINRLCDLALLVGFAEERGQLGPAEIESVADELLAAAPA